MRAKKLPTLRGRTKSAVIERRFIRLKENLFTEVETAPETRCLFLRQHENSSAFFQAVLYAVCRGNIGRQNGLIRRNAAAIFRQLPVRFRADRHTVRISFSRNPPCRSYFIQIYYIYGVITQL